MPSIDDFRQFLVLSEFLSFSAAAESMFITQPALSRHITALENSLDVKLFERTTQTVKLTPAGLLFKEHIRSIVDEYDDLASRLQILKSGFSDRLRISCPYYAMHDYLGPIPELFGGIHPNIKLQYTMGAPHEAMQYLLEDKVDLAILAKYQLPHTNMLKRCDLYEERLGVLLNKNDPLAQKSELSLSDLKDHAFFNVGDSYFTASWHYTLKLCRSAGFAPGNPTLFNQMETLIMALRYAERSTTVVGHHMRNQESDIIAYRPLIDANCSRKISIWYKPDNNNGAIEKFVKCYTHNPFARN